MSAAIHGDDEVVVRDVDTPSSSTRKVIKDRDARWVSGLYPERYDKEQEEELRRKMAETQNPWAGNAHWLSRPLFYGNFAILFLLLRIFLAGLPVVDGYTLGLTDHHLELAPEGDFYHRLEYPMEEVPTWKLIAAMTPLDYAYLAACPFFCAFFCGYLSLNFAVATQSMVNFFGVGFAVVGFMSQIGDLILLHISCYGKEPVPSTNQCFFPITLHWILETLAIVFPVCGMMTLSYVFDELLYRVKMNDDWWEMAPYWRRFNKWLFITSLPLLVHAAHWTLLWWNEAKTPIHDWHRAALGMQVVVWVIVWRRCKSQAPFVVHWQERPTRKQQQPKPAAEILHKKKND